MTDLTLLTSKHDLLKACNRLSIVLKTGTKLYKRPLKHHWENGVWNVYWHRRYGFWATVDPSPKQKRFWLSLGTDDPATNPSLRMVCRATVSKVGGEDHSFGGRFLSDGRDIYLAHTGRIVGPGGVNKGSFVTWYAKRWGITWPDGIVIGSLSSPRFLRSLATFVSRVEWFKTSAESIEDQLDQDASDADQEGEFDPNNVTRSNQKILRSINIRRGQSGFRNKLLKAYSGRCAICDCDCIDALEGAHILRYSGEDTNHVQNGLLLRADLHTLFDLGKIGVDPRTYRIVVSKKLMHTAYRKYNGRRLRLPRTPANRPNEDVLLEHLKLWKLK